MQEEGMTNMWEESDKGGFGRREGKENRSGGGWTV